jgi:hypothetical protein
MICGYLSVHLGSNSSARKEDPNFLPTDGVGGTSRAKQSRRIPLAGRRQTRRAAG